jgi:hypothetical protein
MWMNLVVMPRTKKNRLLRNQSKRQAVPILNQSINLACERFFRSRGMSMRNPFDGWQSATKTEEDADLQ